MRGSAYLNFDFALPGEPANDKAGGFWPQGPNSTATGNWMFGICRKAFLLVMLGDALNLTANVSLPANIHLIWCYVATLMVILYHIMSS